MVAALAGPDKGPRSTPHGVGRLGADVIRRLRLRLLTVGPWRGPSMDGLRGFCHEVLD